MFGDIGKNICVLQQRGRDSKEYHQICHDQTAARTTAARITIAAETTKRTLQHSAEAG